MHPDLLQAIILAAIAKTPDGIKKQLKSSVQAEREKAEGMHAASIMIAILQHRWRGEQRSVWARR